MAFDPDDVRTPHGIRHRLGPVLQPGERIVWTGASSPGAHVAGHVPGLAFSILFTLMAGGTTFQRILRGDFAISPIAAVFVLIGLGTLAVSLYQIVGDLAVGWAVTDRRVHRLSRWGTVSTEIRGRASVEMQTRPGGRGDLIVRMPEMHDAGGDRVYPSVRLLDVDDVRGAAAAIAAARTDGEIVNGTSASAILPG